jgi:hypothetical protein
MDLPNLSTQSDLSPGRDVSVVIDDRIANLLIGLERQKEELGPIADELIELLRHMGATAPPV